MKSTVVARREGTITKSEWKLRVIAVLLCLGLTSIAVLPFFVIGEAEGSGCCGGSMPATHDMAMHYNQMQFFWRGLASGRLYPRWEDVTHSGYGAPTSIFYPPAIYYLSSLFYLALGEWRLVLAVLLFVLMAASGLAIYWYARQSMSWSASIVAMAVYIIAPYHLLNQYQRGAITEQMSFIWMPLALLFAERYLGEKAEFKLPMLIVLAAISGAFLFSHPPTAYQFILIFGLCAFGGTVRSGGWRGLVMIAGAVLWGSMIAAAYIFPVAAEQNQIHIEDVEDMWPYHDSYVFDYGQSIYDHTYDDFTIRLDRIWVLNAAAIILIGLLLFILRRYSQRSGSHSRLWLWLAAGCLSLFFMTEYSYPIGRFIPKIETGVFCWRMLSIASLVVALIAGTCWQVAVDSMAERRRELSIICGLSALSVLVLSGAMSVWYVAKPMYRAEAFRVMPEHYNRAIIPKGTPYEVPEMEPVRLASGAGQVSIDQMQPEFRRYSVDLERADQLLIRTSNFPGWTALVDGEIAEIRTGMAGSIVIDLPAGKHHVTLDFRSTPIRRLCNWITVISTALLFSVYIVARRRSRNGQNRKAD